MNESISLQSAPDTAASYEASIEQHLIEMQLLNEQMQSDRLEIDRLKIETCALKDQTRSLLTSMGAGF